MLNDEVGAEDCPLPPLSLPALLGGWASRTGRCPVVRADPGKMPAVSAGWESSPRRLVERPCIRGPFHLFERRAQKSPRSPRGVDFFRCLGYPVISEFTGCLADGCRSLTRGFPIPLPTSDISTLPRRVQAVVRGSALTLTHADVQGSSPQREPAADERDG